MRRLALFLGGALAGVLALRVISWTETPRPAGERWGPSEAPPALVDPRREPPAPARLPARQPGPGPRLSLEPPPGFHAGPVEVEAVLLEPLPGALRFTTDGTEPGPESPAVEGRISLSASTVLRLGAFRGGERISAVVSASYFLAPLPPLRVISIALDPQDFRTVHLHSEARGRESERPAFMEILGRDGRREAATGFGLRLHGGAGRRGGLGTKKAYRAYFRKAYGEGRFRSWRTWKGGASSLFPDSPVNEFDVLVLRSGYNDRFRPGRGDYNMRAAYVRDEVVRRIHGDMGCPHAHGTWALLYINMQPWGLYNVVERMDSDFCASYMGEGRWDVMKTGDEVLSGSREEWDSLQAFFQESDLESPEAYAEVQRRLDVKNFTAYMILNLWSQNHDWPYNNWYAARRRQPPGKWVFLSWDAEWALGLSPGGHRADSLAYVLSRHSSLRNMLAGLLRNAAYREHFLEEVRRHLAGALRPERVIAHIDREAEAIAAVIPEELASFAEGQYRFEDWQENVEALRRFARERGEFFLDLVEGYLAEPARLEALLSMPAMEAEWAPGMPGRQVRPFFLEQGAEAPGQPR